MTGKSETIQTSGPFEARTLHFLPPLVHRQEALAECRHVRVSDVLYAGLGDAVPRLPPLRKAPVLHYDGDAPPVIQLVQADDRLGVVMQRMASQELHPSGGYVGVHLRRDQYRDLVLPGGVEEDLGLPDEVVPGLRIIVVQTVEHREGVYDHKRYRTGGRQLLHLVYAVGLLLEAVDLEYQEVLDTLLLSGEDLRQPVRGQPLGVDVGDLPSGGGYVTGDLEADVGLSRPGLAVEEGDAPRLDPASKETVQLGASKRYPIHDDVKQSVR